MHIKEMDISAFLRYLLAYYRDLKVFVRSLYDGYYLFYTEYTVESES